MRSLVFGLALCVATPLAAAKKPTAPVIPDSEKELIDKWIVREVTIDGKPTPAQIGQKKGDVITIKGRAHRFFLR